MVTSMPKFGSDINLILKGISKVLLAKSLQ